MSDIQATASEEGTVAPRVFLATGCPPSLTHVYPNPVRGSVAHTYEGSLGYQPPTRFRQGITAPSKPKSMRVASFESAATRALFDWCPSGLNELTRWLKF